MNPEEEPPSGEWLDRLERALAGENAPEGEQDEVLELAAQLGGALAPLRTLDETAQQHRLRLLRRFQGRPTPLPPRQRLPRPRLLLLLATFLLVALSIGVLGLAGLGGLRQAATTALRDSTSLTQINGLSVTGLSRPHAGIHPYPLLPATLPADTHASAYGVITSPSDPNLLSAFVADYRISGQDVLVYEQPSDLLFPSASAQPVQIGTQPGQIFQDAAGTRALQWVQSGMLCQLTSKLSVERLTALALLFEPIQSWDVIL
ncbi:MAG TPA: hypothetical protein VH540_06910 [Ktedonobacterales bacterium]|jgi:hypothetical protein